MLLLLFSEFSFEIRSVESSNSQLLLQTSLESINDAASSEIFHSVSQHFELVKIPPRLHELFRILSETAIRDARSVSGGLTLAEIQNEVESSDSEILQGLKNFGAWMRDDRGKETARMIEFDLSARLLLVALDFAVSNGWTRIQDGEPLYEIPYTGFINAFADEKS